MNKQETQTQFEAVCFMHGYVIARKQDQLTDYMDIYAEEPK